MFMAVYWMDYPVKNEPGEYQMLENDVIKLGRTTLLVRKIGYAENEIKALDICDSLKANSSESPLDEEEINYWTENQQINRGKCLQDKEQIRRAKIILRQQGADWICKFCKKEQISSLN